MDDPDWLRPARPWRAVQALLIAMVVVAAGVVALFSFGPARLRFWQCEDRVERATMRAAIDGYYAHCWNRPKLLTGPSDTDGDGEGTGWYEVKVFGIDKDGSPVSFLFVGRKTASSGWTVLSEATGP